MLQNIIVILIVVLAVVVLFRRILKGKGGCNCAGKSAEEKKNGSCGGCSLNDKK